MSIKPSVLERLRLLMDDSRRGTLLIDEFDTLVAQASGADVELLRRTFYIYNNVRRGDVKVPDNEMELLLQDFQETQDRYPYFHWLALNLLGICQYRAQRYEAALKTYTYGARFAAEHGMHHNRTCSLVNLGFTHATLNQAELALRYLVPIATAGTHPWRLYCFANQFLASVYRDHDQPARELEHLCSSAQDRSTLEGRSLLARLLVRLGRITEARNVRTLNWERPRGLASNRAVNY